MGGCQNYGPSLGTLNIRCRITLGTQKGTIILTTTLMDCPHGVTIANKAIRVFLKKLCVAHGMAERCFGLMMDAAGGYAHGRQAGKQRGLSWNKFCLGVLGFGV